VGFFDTQGNLLHDNIYYQPVSVLWYPASMWQASQRVAVSTLPWQMDADQVVLAAGLYVGEEGWTSGARLPATDAAGLPVLEDGTLLRLGGFARKATGDWEALPLLPPSFAGLSAQPVTFNFGETLQLNEAFLPTEVKASAPLSLVLTWQRDGQAPPNLSRFVHLLDSTGGRVAQVDGQIADAFGPLPISGWPVGESVYDLVTLALPATLPPGEYTLAVGLYDWQTGERLRAVGAGASEDGAAAIGLVQIVP
jgi:hypothetical protein